MPKDAKEFVGFIRPKIIISTACIGISSYLFFNSINPALFFILLGCACLSLGGYSFNMITDRKEDFINRGKINAFAASNVGLVISAVFYLLGAISMFVLSATLFLEYAAIAVFSIAYSLFRLKDYLHVKNFYTAFLGGAFFLIGTMHVSVEIFSYSFLMAVLIYTLSLLGDLRDHKGDKKAGIKTVPTHLGYEISRRIASFSIVSFIAFILLFGAFKFFLFLPFAIYSLFILIKKNMPKLAHYNLMISIIHLPFLSLGIHLISF